jgi:hypothetical protein
VGQLFWTVGSDQIESTDTQGGPGRAGDGTRREPPCCGPGLPATRRNAPHRRSGRRRGRRRCRRDPSNICCYDSSEGAGVRRGRLRRRLWGRWVCISACTGPFSAPDYPAGTRRVGRGSAALAPGPRRSRCRHSRSWRRGTAFRLGDGPGRMEGRRGVKQCPCRGRVDGRVGVVDAARRSRQAPNQALRRPRLNPSALTAAHLRAGAHTLVARARAARPAAPASVRG